MKQFCFILSALLINAFLTTCSIQEVQNPSAQQTIANNNRESFRLMFYNVENLFDAQDDSLKNDEEFLPEGERHWSEYKYYEKLQKTAKVIIAVGGWQLPEIVGLAEIENHNVLQQLIFMTSLKNSNYRIVHKESPDQRGIDVALFYDNQQFNPINYRAIPIHFPDQNRRKTRDILYVSGTTQQDDTLHIFVNHWPSRLGGQLESEPKRLFVASVLRQAVDSLLTLHSNPNVVIMGDLNDYPENKSLTEVLKARINFDTIAPRELYNLAYYLQEEKGAGSHKYQEKWGMLDQIIVSGQLLLPESPLYTTPDDAAVFDANFLLEKDERNVGYRPARTYIGYRFNGGFSDHLPVYLDLYAAPRNSD